MGDVITTRGLARTFRTRSGEVEAVRGVDIDVAEGEIVGFLGPNGAGKTTTLRMLVTLLEPTAGEATVAGHDLRTAPGAVRRDIGYVAQGRSTERAAKVREELVDQAALYGITGGEARARADELTRDFELESFAGRLVKELSGGQRRRLEVALGMVHRPRLVFLDEPTTGLDPQSRANLWEHVRSLRGTHGSTVFITTHYLEEADALCDRVLILDEGRIIAAGTPDELKRHLGGDQITVEVRGDVEAARAALAAAVASGTAEVAGPSSLRLAVAHGDREIPGVVRALDAAGVEVEAMELLRPSLDDVFLSLTGRSLRDDA